MKRSRSSRTSAATWSTHTAASSLINRSKDSMMLRRPCFVSASRVARALCGRYWLVVRCARSTARDSRHHWRRAGSARLVGLTRAATRPCVAGSQQQAARGWGVSPARSARGGDRGVYVDILGNHPGSRGIRFPCQLEHASSVFVLHRQSVRIRRVPFSRHRRIMMRHEYQQLTAVFAHRVAKIATCTGEIQLGFQTGFTIDRPAHQGS